MTPQQNKADELIERFMDVPECENHFSRHAYGYVCNHQAIQCAIICVEEILEAGPTSPSDGVDIWRDLNNSSHYWQSVLNELKSRL